MERDNRERSEEMKQDRRLKPIQGDNNQLQPQKCPRCESLNTKFCYYNNYSLSQPRYFCKTCRRYWTQGGTLRNVPVGGGCRKGKRMKTSSSTVPSSSSGEKSNSRSQSHQLNLGTALNSVSNTALVGLSSTATKDQSDTNLVPPSIGSFYSGSGFLNSLAAIQSLSNQTPQSNNFPLNHQPPAPSVNHLDLGGNTSNLNLLQGFNAIAPFGSNPQRQQFYQIGSSSSHQQQNWHQSFNNNNNPTIPDNALWSISTSTTAANNNTNTAAASAASFPLNPNDNQWHDLSGYGPPP